MKVSINILNYNTFEKSKNCIESCLDQADIDYEILLIDNNSTDDSFIKLKEIFGNRISYLKNDNNFGYAKGNNIGIAYCFERGIRFSLILNSDITIVGKHLLKQLIEVISNNDNCAIAAPLIYNVSNSGQIFNQNDSTYLKLLRQFGIIPKNIKISDRLHTISEAQGSALLVDNEMFLRLGGFPEHFFMYGEEGYFSKKVLWDDKLIIWVKDKDNFVLHHHDKSKKIDAWRLYLMGRNRYLEMYENKSVHPIKWPLVFDMFELKMRFDSIRKKDLKWYVLGVNNAKRLVNHNSDNQKFIDDAISFINTHKE